MIYYVQRKEVFSLPIGKESERIATIISKDLAKKIADLAKLEKRSVSAMTAILIEKGLDSFKKE